MQEVAGVEKAIRHSEGAHNAAAFDGVESEEHTTIIKSTKTTFKSKYPEFTTIITAS